MLTQFKKRTALLVTLAVACATVAIVPSAMAAASKVPNGAAVATAAVGAYSAPTEMETMTACPPGSAAAAGFSDTTSTDVDCIKMYGITQGTTATTYEPDGTIPRWQMALFIHRMFGPTGVAAAGLTAVPAFTDTSGLSADIQAAITALASHGITTGTTATTYGPDSNVTREQMAMFLKRFAAIAKQPADGTGILGAMTLDIGTAGVGNGDHNYSDIAGTTSEGYESIVALYNLGVTEGACLAGASYTCATTYRPGDDITRGEMASFIKRLLDQSNARPAGVSIQAVEGIATAGAKTTMVSVRGADFSPSMNVLVDEFYDTADTAAERALAAEDPFDALGVCRSAALAAAQGTLCKIDTADLVTNSAGNVIGHNMSTEASHTADWYVWTGEVGTLYNESSAPGYLYSVTMDATATAPVYADGASTVVTISGGDAGNAETLDMNTYHGNIPGASDDGILTYQGTSRTATITMKKTSAPTSTVVDGYTFKVVDKVVSYNGTTAINTSYVTSSSGVATFDITCSADPAPTALNGIGNADAGYWEHHMVTITSATATGNGWPALGSDPMSGATWPTDGGGGSKLNVSCDDEARSHTAGATANTLSISGNHFAGAAGGSLVTVTTTAYDQYGVGIAGITSEITQATDGAGAVDQATLTSNALGKATLTTVVCESTAGNANGTEAFAVTTAGSDFSNITATVAHAGGATDIGTTVYCSTPVTNAVTAGGDGWGKVTDVQEVQKVMYAANSAPTVAVDADGGSIKCHIGIEANLSAAIAHGEHTANNIRDDLNAITGLSGAVVTMFAGAATVYGVTHPASDAANAGFYVQFPANTGNWPQLVCSDLLSGADNFETAGGAAEPNPSTLVQGVAGQVSTLVDADTAANTMVVKYVTKTTNAAGATAEATTYRSLTWDSDDIFMGATPGMTEAAFETALAAVTNTSTNVSGMLRTVATGTGLSVFQLG